MEPRQGFSHDWDKVTQGGLQGRGNVRSLAAMNIFRTGKFRLLYLLALVQLVGGPLVLFQVTVLCKLTLDETPRVGVARAAVLAWHSDDFRAVVAGTETALPDAAKIPGSDKGPEQKVAKVKDPGIPWNVVALKHAASSVYCRIVDRERVWTPAQAQAPPGPPPRMM